MGSDAHRGADALHDDRYSRERPEPLGGGLCQGADNYEVRATKAIEADTYLSSMMPHMHVRGKSSRYTVVYPDGRREVALWVPSCDFN